MSLWGGYTDHKIVSQEYLHKQNWKVIQQNIADKLKIQSNQIIVISTCLRFEIYFESHNEIKPETTLQSFGLTPINEPKQIFHRLVRIASGLESSIVGEKAILEQVKRAMVKTELQNSPNLSRLFSEALNYAVKIREKHQFYNPHSYATIGAELLSEYTSPIYKGLLIIGAGSMADEFISAFELLCSQYRQHPVFIANRTKSSAIKLTKRHRITKNSTVITLQEIERVLPDVSHIFIAIGGDNIYETFGNGVKNLAVVDISFPPKVDIGTTVLHSNFNQKISLCNQHIQGKALYLGNEIEQGKYF